MGKNLGGGNKINIIYNLYILLLLQYSTTCSPLGREREESNWRMVVNRELRSMLKLLYIPAFYTYILSHYDFIPLYSYTVHSNDYAN